MRKLAFYINAAEFTSRVSAHAEMKKVFKNYEYYGNSLDALHDVLTSIRQDAKITVAGLSSARETLGQYADKIREVFSDSALENPHLTVLFPEEKTK